MYSCLKILKKSDIYPERCEDVIQLDRWLKEIKLSKWEINDLILQLWSCVFDGN